MIAFDTDVFTEILAGEPVYVQRAAGIPREQQAIPIVVAEEILRGGNSGDTQFWGQHTQFRPALGMLSPDS